MSLHQLANHMSAQGRGPDSALVHMSPREVAGLQSLAMAHGGSLTVNPQTGLPEAGFLDRLLPTLLGGAATFFSGGAITPFMAAMGVGGLTALTSKDLGKGLMAGLGAYGGGSIVEGLAGFGTGALSAEAGKAALPAGMDPLGYEAEQLSQNAVSSKLANASYYDKLAAGASNAMTNPRGALSAVGGGSELMGAAKIAAPLMSALSGKEATSVPTFGQIAFDPRPANVSMRRDQLAYRPDTGSSAQRGNFGPMYIDQFTAADGGFVSDGGIERFAGGGISIDPIEPPLGGIPLDPNYDYSGYGRKPRARVAPVVQPKALPKPDFVGADGKTYRYDPMKKSWYVFKDVPEKTNPGVATLMGNDGAPGNDGVSPPSTPFSGYDPNAYSGGLLGLALGQKSAADAANTPVTDAVGTPVSAAPAGPDVAADRSARDSDVAQFGEGIAPAGPAAPDVAADRSARDSDVAQFGEGIAPAAPAAPAAPDDTQSASRSMGAPAAPSTTVGVTAPDTTTDTAPDTTPGGGDVSEGPGADAVGGGGVDVGGDSPFAAGGLTAFAAGGLGSLGGYSDGGRLLRGPGDGVSDSIPATVGNRQPARLADGEFVVPARIVSELGNGSTEAGARALYKMMDRIQANRRKTTGKNRVAVNSKSHKYLPA